MSLCGPRCLFTNPITALIVGGLLLIVSCSFLLEKGNADLSSLLEFSHPICHSKEKIEDCNAEFESVTRCNSRDLNPALNQLAETTCLKVFKVNIHRDCPFWAIEKICGADGRDKCSVCECSKDQIPLPWRAEEKEIRVHTGHGHMETAAENERTRIREGQVEEIWFDAGPEETKTYVDLTKNTEGYTGYNGEVPVATKKEDSLASLFGLATVPQKPVSVWEAIYSENCFQVSEDMCFEERVFYRMISGLHSSISVHIAAHYEFDEKLNTWKSNFPELNRRVLQHPERVSNMYFAFLFMLRAARKARDLLSNYTCNTGNFLEDQQTSLLLKQIIESDLACSESFDESVIFALPNKTDMKLQFQHFFRNISRILDCISCMKCRVYSKLQFTAAGTAAKILFADDPRTIESLTHNEIVALVQTMRQVSNSILWLRQLSSEHAMIEYRSLALQYARDYGSHFAIACAAFVLLITIIAQIRRRGCCACTKSGDSAGESKKSQ